MKMPGNVSALTEPDHYGDLLLEAVHGGDLVSQQQSTDMAKRAKLLIYSYVNTRAFALSTLPALLFSPATLVGIQGLTRKCNTVDGYE